MRLALISPARKESCDFWDFKFAARLLGKEYGGGPHVSLPTIAALTPEDIEVAIIDENVQGIDFNSRYDLVGITCNTSLVKRAYEIADRFRKNNIPVILGGIHASMLPQEAAQHADSVLIGEAENIWATIIDDFRNKKLKPLYIPAEKPDLSNSPIPRWDLLKNNLYNIHIMQTARGCPFECEFCSVTNFLGKTYRYKPIENVLKEIESLLLIDPGKGIFFADDNIVSNVPRAKELFKALTPYKLKYWWGQATINVAKDDELLTLMYQSGCRQLLIGFESLSQDNLTLMGKTKVNNATEYKHLIDKIHSYGIAIVGAFVLGSDYDDKNVFSDLVKFIQDTHIAFPQISILTPLPGSCLSERLEKEKRILSRDWDKYTCSEVCFKPKLMSPEELQQGYARTLKEIYSYDNLYARLKKLWRENVLVKHAASPFNLFSGIRFFIILKTLFAKDRKRFFFAAKCLLGNRRASTVSVIFGLDLHDFAFNFGAGNKK